MKRITLNVGGLRFGALEWGDPEGRLALLVHGYPDTAWTWRHLGPHLAQRGFRAVAPFTRGYAPTEIPGSGRYLLSDQAEDLLALRVALGGDSSAVLVGHDWGAAALWAVSAREPEAFCRYVALSVPPPSALLTPFRSLRTLGLGGRQARLSWYFLYQQLPGSERTLDRLIPKLWRDWSPGYDAAEDLAQVFAALDTPARRRAALSYYRDNLRGGLRATLTLRAGAPALYLHGEQDGCMQVALAELGARELPPGSRFQAVPGTGHFLQLEDPATVNRLIEEWLSAPAASG